MDCRGASPTGLQSADLLRDTDYQAGQEFAAAAMSRSAEALLVPSATRLGDNLVLFTGQLRAGSVTKTAGNRQPRLYVPRP